MGARELRWNARSEENPAHHKFYLLIINDNRGADRVTQKAREQLKPTEELVVLTHGQIKGTKLRYKLVTFTSYLSDPSSINWAKVYRGKVIRDRELVERDQTDGLANYVDEKMTSS